MNEMNVHILELVNHLCQMPSALLELSGFRAVDFDNVRSLIFESDVRLAVKFNDERHFISAVAVIVAGAEFGFRRCR